MINLALLYASWPYLLHGAIVSMKIAYFSCAIGIVIGTILGVGQTTKSALLYWPITAYVTITRGTPMLLQIFFFYVGIAQILGVSLEPITWAIIAIGLNSACYISQIVRSGIESVNKGTIEAAQVLGFSKWQATRYIVLPQAFRTVLPTLGNEFVTLIKDSSLASIIGVPELFKEATSIIATTFDPISLYTMIGIIYLAMTGFVSVLLSLYEKKLKKQC